MAEPFEDSRRLTGCNLYFSGTGAALEAARGLAFDDGALARWRENIAAARAALGWAETDIAVRRHRSGASLAFAAPPDQLYAATEVNEWAWWAALARQAPEPLPHAPGHAAVRDAASAIETLRALAAAEANPVLPALRDAAEARGLSFLADDDVVSIGAGDGARAWPIDALPAPPDLDWPALHAIPTAIVTGSNGKTTTVRLLAALLRAHGWPTAHSCTDGVFFDGALLEGGDFSGPGGARAALRHPRARAAVLETARGGILRRGLAACRADAAIVTNVSADHFGEYGIHDLDALARVKLTVARAIGADGLLVLNADDPMLVAHASALSCPIGWFGSDFEAPRLVQARGHGLPTCGVRDARLWLGAGGEAYDLGALADIPLTLGGRAAYNVANAAAAALAARAMGVAADTIAGVLRRFGSARGDNPGRLQQWTFGTLRVVVDYAHNPDGLRGLLEAVDAGARGGRLAILLGHAGNREDADLRAVASVAASLRPQRVLLKDIAGYERGRAAGEVAAIMRAQLLEDGVAAERIGLCLDEVEAARALLRWARDGDLVVLPVHEAAARDRVVAVLERMQSQHWQAGDPLPPMETPDE